MDSDSEADDTSDEVESEDEETDEQQESEAEQANDKTSDDGEKGDDSPVWETSDLPAATELEKTLSDLKIKPNMLPPHPLIDDYILGLDMSGMPVPMNDLTS